ncbi:hypothetical protein JTZ62_05015 [Mammaliicoccus sciuri]|uniref:hypothetical protein n=1 Tax=Mammaliicoccus sciuri TaxID=1296 RepID=UPI0019D3A178|nr:hypothetical protein [Mammaliicoccus sciuri]QSN68520.1 hypothetical protein JTZ62_05015 [Mammaliicoccus sciuri]UIU23262.1 hypothetical protein LLZ87_05030 [Mammaliicoccus sciuri]UIU26168.1 hypothetical protein LLZ92_05030 [Mammaliicoccus sciuri]
MTKLYYADELKDITEKHMSEDVKHLLEEIAVATMLQAKSGDYAFTLRTKYMHEIRHMLERKGYEVSELKNQTNVYLISWD